LRLAVRGRVRRIRHRRKEKDVRFHEHRGDRRKKKPLPRPTPAQLAAAHAEALKCREWVRSEKTTAANAPNGQSPLRPKRPRDEAKERAQFAANIARAEFGRFYWDEERAKEAGKKKPPRSYRRRNDKPLPSS
jgi:hypothetical protein